jgi:plasmid maintenance system antidote protein VapI
MPTSPDPTDPISGLLRRRIVESGLSLARLARATGVERMSISRFVRGEQSLRLDMADRLAVFLGLELCDRRSDEGPTGAEEVRGHRPAQ